jgi:Flp pilus assembly protein TadG
MTCHADSPQARQMRARIRQEHGSVTLFLAIAAVGLMAMAGLVVDGGGKVRAAQRADRLAAEAARAAGQAIDLTAALRGEAIHVDRRAALAAADDYLQATGADGEASVSRDGRAIVVTTRATAPTVFLGLLGIPALEVSGRAEAVLVHTEGGDLR